MDTDDLRDVMSEMKRMEKRINELRECTVSANTGTQGAYIWNNKQHCEVYGYDEGLRGLSSKRRASVKRAALDLRQELLKLTK